ncbi:MAG: Hpt domain-containing protein [Vampirovibrionales bacterium]
MPQSFTTQVPLFDPTQLLANLGGDLELACELVHLYCVEAPHLQEQLGLAITQNNPEATERLAHGLKGASANVCACQVQAACAAIEQAAKQADWPTVHAYWGPLSESLQAYCNHASHLFPPLP